MRTVRHEILRRLHEARMWGRSLAGPVRAGTSSYTRQLDEEIEHYSKLHADAATLFEPAPAVWDAVLDKAAVRIEQTLGAPWPGYIATRLNRTDARMLSLGCGTAGVELTIAGEAPSARYFCTDVNGDLFHRARQQASEAGYRFDFATADLNTAAYDWGVFDVILCHASLHHLVELEHVMAGIGRSLAPDGELIAIDINAPNGFRMASATRRVAAALFSTLPERYRWNYTAYEQKWLDGKIYNPPAMMPGMECQRSADVLPLLRSHFREHCFVPYFSLCRRFFDTVYGPNYDLSRPLDRAIVEWIWELDCHYLQTGELPPESFFGIYRL